MKSGMRSVLGMGDICEASTAAEKRFRDRSVIWEGVTRGFEKGPL